jgi:hypothetical protein
MTREPKRVTMGPAARRQLLESELGGARGIVVQREKKLEEARAARNRAIVGLGRLPESVRPTSTEVSKLAGVSRQYVVRLWEA